MNPKVHSMGKMYLIYILKTNLTFDVPRVLNKTLKAIVPGRKYNYCPNNF